MSRFLPRAAALAIAYSLVLLAIVGVAEAAAAPPTDRAPVDLSTQVDQADGTPSSSQIVEAGPARFEVLAPDLIRLEYSPTRHFLDQPTFTALDRRAEAAAYTVTRKNGEIAIETADAVLHYELGSGPFGPENTSLRLLHPSADGNRSARLAWLGECTVGQACQSGAATLGGGAALRANARGYRSPGGYVAEMTAPGAEASWQVLGAAEAGTKVTLRYANLSSAPETMHLTAGGHVTQIELPPTGATGGWGTVSAPTDFSGHDHSVTIACDAGDDCGAYLDSVTVESPHRPAVPVQPSRPLGGFIRSFDSTDGTYSEKPVCSPGQSNTTCEAVFPRMQQGVLDRQGWYLLDDTASDTWTGSGWIHRRPAGDVEDGYLFAYGTDYKAALRSLKGLTGPAPMLPEYIFGNWYSQLNNDTSEQYEDEVLPAFAANHVPLDSLSIDTAWKAPGQWDGWSWSPSLFPDPKGFLGRVRKDGIHVALNIHSSISPTDPLYPQTAALAGGELPQGSCISALSATAPRIGCGVWNWSNVKQAESYFALHRPLIKDGVSFWWLDWCCDDSFVGSPGVTPDAWINHLYAQAKLDAGERGFVLARIGAYYTTFQPTGQGGWAGLSVTGPWADHRSAIHFTGDTSGTWNTLAFEAQLTQDEGAIGEPYVSDDIGSFGGPPVKSPSDPPDLYLRWLQLGTFQPIMREHSSRGNRLPWQYGEPTQAIGNQFMRLRAQLVPYLYTLARESTQSGLPIDRPLYLEHPDLKAAYEHPTESLLGDDVLVAPVTSPGEVAEQKVWFPPGTWTDWFTGKSYEGPSTHTLQVPLNQAPVFVKAGGVVTLQPPDRQAGKAPDAPLTLRAYPGNGHFDLYQDSGEGLGYKTGQFATTTIKVERPAAGETAVVVGPARGSYPGQPGRRRFTLDLQRTARPHEVLLDGRRLGQGRWTYDAQTKTLRVSFGARRAESATVEAIDGGARGRP